MTFLEILLLRDVFFLKIIQFQLICLGRLIEYSNGLLLRNSKIQDSRSIHHKNYVANEVVYNRTLPTVYKMIESFKIHHRWDYKSG